MKLDHIAIWSNQWGKCVRELERVTGLPALEGYADGAQKISSGFRFSNGPFLDIFPLLPGSSRRRPLIGLQGDIGSVSEIADKNGWQTVIHKREDTAETGRPPWSTLSFRRGQGLLSSIFVIEYANDPGAWNNPDFSGPLYTGSFSSDHSAALERVILQCEHLEEAQQQLAAIAGKPVALLELQAGPANGFVRFECREPDSDLAPRSWPDDHKG